MSCSITLRQGGSVTEFGAPLTLLSTSTDWVTRHQPCQHFHNGCWVQMQVLALTQQTSLPTQTPVLNFDNSLRDPKLSANNLHLYRRDSEISVGYFVFKNH